VGSGASAAPQATVNIRMTPSSVSFAIEFPPQNSKSAVCPKSYAMDITPPLQDLANESCSSVFNLHPYLKVLESVNPLKARFSLIFELPMDGLPP
jgi:hypothetical protein